VVELNRSVVFVPHHRKEVGGGVEGGTGVGWGGLGWAMPKGRGGGGVAVTCAPDRTVKNTSWLIGLRVSSVGAETDTCADGGRLVYVARTTTPEARVEKPSLPT
jgi:hypothetical protein